MKTFNIVQTKRIKTKAIERAEANGEAIVKAGRVLEICEGRRRRNDNVLGEEDARDLLSLHNHKYMSEEKKTNGGEAEGTEEGKEEYQRSSRIQLGLEPID